MSAVAPEQALSGETLTVLARAGEELLEEERRAFLAGRFEEVAPIARRKLVLLEQLEEAAQQRPQSAAGLVALEKLIAVSRRNEEIIMAAKQGLAHARRRIKSIHGARRGAVAYEEDGSEITSRADRQQTLKSA